MGQSRALQSPPGPDQLLSVPQNPQAEHGWVFGIFLERDECAKMPGRREIKGGKEEKEKD